MCYAGWVKKDLCGPGPSEPLLETPGHPFRAQVTEIPNPDQDSLRPQNLEKVKMGSVGTFSHGACTAPIITVFIPAIPRKTTLLYLVSMCSRHGGGRPLGPGRQLPPQLTVGRRPLGGGGGGGGGLEGGSRRGAGEGGSRGGGGGGRFPGFPWGGGVSGTSEQLGMRPRCDPTVRTAPSHNRG